VSERGDGDLPLRVSTLELFFDLVFVFAITQLTSILSRDVSVAAGSAATIARSARSSSSMPK